METFLLDAGSGARGGLHAHFTAWEESAQISVLFGMIAGQSHVRGGVA